MMNKNLLMDKISLIKKEFSILFSNFLFYFKSLSATSKNRIFIVFIICLIFFLLFFALNKFLEVSRIQKVDIPAEIQSSSKNNSKILSRLVVSENYVCDEHVNKKYICYARDKTGNWKQVARY